MVAARKKATSSKSKELEGEEKTNVQQESQEEQKVEESNAESKEVIKDSKDTEYETEKDDNKKETSEEKDDNKKTNDTKVEAKKDANSKTDEPTGWDCDDVVIGDSIPSKTNWDDGLKDSQQIQGDSNSTKNDDAKNGWNTGNNDNWSSRNNNENRYGGSRNPSRDRFETPRENRDRRTDDYSRPPRRYEPHEDRKFSNEFSDRRPSYPRQQYPYPPRDDYPQKRYASDNGEYGRHYVGGRDNKRPRFEGRDSYASQGGDHYDGFDSRSSHRGGYDRVAPPRDHQYNDEPYKRDADYRRPPPPSYDNPRYERGYERSRPYDPVSAPPRDEDRPPRIKRPIPAEVPPSRVLGIFGLSIHATEDDIKEFLAEEFPESKDYKVTIIQDRHTRMSKGYGFVYFQSIQESIMAKERLTGRAIKGKEIRVDFSISDVLRPNYR